MGKLKRQGETGAGANYLSRNQALRRLQVSLSDFRRLCILKGIFPRQPKNRSALKKAGKNIAADQTFYHLKDIQMLMDEPLLDKFREMRAFSKKVKKVIGKEEWAKLGTMRAPVYTLDHLVRERYPTFTDALEDVGEALSMVALFSLLPMEKITEIGNDVLRSVPQQRLDHAKTCFSLLRHFESFVMATGCLKRSFVSIKGIYYEAEIDGKSIVWLCPLEFSPIIPTDVDFRVMLTFLEFYECLLKFVNYRLLKRIGVDFPVEGDAFTVGTDRLVLCSDLGCIVSQGDDKQEQLLKGKKVFLSREVPKRALSFVCQAMGCDSIGWQELEESGCSPLSEDDPSIDYQIVDRPSLSRTIPGRIYVQPQWLFDSLNANSLLDTMPYGIGACLPDHLSPFHVANMDVAEAKQDTEQEPEEVKEQKMLAASLLSKKKKKLYDRIKHSQKAKADQKSRLEKKKAALSA